jgi:GWxTD domain-containing protein
MVIARLSLVLLLVMPISAEAQRTAEDSLRHWLDGPVRLLLTEEEVSLASQMLSPEQQTEFRTWFWIRRDPDPETLRNEFREAFHARVAYVDRQFGDRGAGEAGWMTAPGAIQLVLGDPDEVRRLPKGVFAEGSYRDLTVWEYGPAAPGGALSVPFVRVSERMVVVEDPRTGALPTFLTQALSRAIRAAVRHPDLPLGGLLMDSRATDVLPTYGSARIDSGALVADMSMSLRDLRGRADEDRLVIELDVDLTGPSAGDGAVCRISEMQFSISSEQFDQWSKRMLHVVLSLPPGSFDPTCSGAVHITEQPTGRSARVTVAARGSELPAPHAVGHVLAVDHSAAHGGVVAAFIEGDETAASSLSRGLPDALIPRR